jgi:hypothetical protein
MFLYITDEIKTSLLSSIKNNLQKSATINKKLRIEDPGQEDVQVGLTVQGVSNILYGLSQMGFYWSHFHIDIKEKFSINIVHLCNKMEKKYSKKVDFSDDESVWKNKKQVINDNDFGYYDYNDNDNDITDFTLLLKSLSTVRFNFQDEFLLSIYNSNNYIKDLKKFKDLVLTMFVRFSEYSTYDDIDLSGYMIFFESRDFAVCVRSLGRYCICEYIYTYIFIYMYIHFA